MENDSLPNQLREKLRSLRTRLFVTPSYERRFHAFCLGAEKSGTHSIAALFADNYRSDHEPDYPPLIAQLAHAPQLEDGRSHASDSAYLQHRDRALWLELESCWLHILHVQELANAFPDAKFILTIRDCYSWLDSLFNHIIMREIGHHWRRAHRLYYRPDKYRHQPGEQASAQGGLYPIRAYLSAWAWHNRRPFEALPPDRVLVLRTVDIESSAPQLATFLGVPPATIVTRKGHQYPNEQKQHLLRRIDRTLLEDTVKECCGDVMARWFPEIRSLDDAVPPHPAASKPV